MRKDLATIKKNLEQLKDKYDDKRRANATTILNPLGSCCPRNQCAFSICGFFSVFTILPPIAAFTYFNFGHTNRNRIGPINLLLGLIEQAKNFNSLNWKTINHLSRQLHSIKQTIESSSSTSNEYRLLLGLITSLEIIFKKIQTEKEDAIATKMRLRVAGNILFPIGGSRNSKECAISSKDIIVKINSFLPQQT